MGLTENIAKIRNAVYGREVREAIAASIEGMGQQTQEYAQQAASSASSAAASASRLQVTTNERGNVVINI